MVAILYASGSICTGTLFRTNAVVTAAHCLDEAIYGDELPVVTSKLDVSGPIALKDTVRARSKHVEPSFDIGIDPQDSLTQFHDIGVLILEEPVAVAPIPLLDPADADLLASNSEVTIVGYGIFGRGEGELGVKHAATTRIAEIGSHELRVGARGEAQNCRGDSGGPALLESGGQQYIVGIVSRSADRLTDCEAGGIDTRADTYAGWVSATADEFGAAPGSIAGGCSASSGGQPVASALIVFLLLATRRRR